MAAATLMIDAGVGILRTMPPPAPEAMDHFRTQAAALGVDWPAGTGYGDLLRRLDATVPAELALLYAAGRLFRGAGYQVLDGTPAAPPRHAAVAAPYAHVTAPLRRLVDRFGLAACHAIARGRDLPEWVRAGLPAVPAAMSASDHTAGELERRCLDAVESAVLAGRVGETFDAIVVAVGRDGDGTVQVLEPAVVAPCSGPLTLGAARPVRLAAVDPVTFAPADRR